MHALILGATGSSGRALLSELASAGPPMEVSAVSRHAASLPGVAKLVLGHYGELARSGAFRRWLARVNVIVHLADGLSVLQRRRFATDRAEAERLIAASERLAVAAREAKVPLIIYVSSIKALCDESDERVLTEAALPRAASLYGRSKLRLEQVLAKTLAGSGTRLAIVRNPVMYAPGKAGSMARLLRLADTPLPLPLAGLRNRRSLLAVCNLASALAVLVRAGPQAAEGTFHVQDGPPLSTTEIVALFRTALGRPHRLLPIGALGAALAQRAPLIAPAARRLYGSLAVCDELFRRTFGWTPAVAADDALAEMAAAYAAGRGETIRATALNGG
jgi:nucleoside-diphosphate-sugar epimerase